MRYIIPLIIWLIPCWCKAQVVEKKFYDKRGLETTEAASEYYELRKAVWSDPDTLKSYYTDGDVLRSVSVVNESGLKEGTSIHYHRNGTMKVSAPYKNGSLTGEVLSYYPDGKPQSVERYTDFHRPPSLVSYWDSLGNQIINEGTGFCRCVFEVAREHRNIEIGKLKASFKDSVWVGRDETWRKVYEETYSTGEFIHGVSYDEKGGQYEYVDLMEMVEFPGGIQLAYEHVMARMRYPKEARKAGTQGRVFVEFTVDTEGAVTDARVLKGIGGGCDEVALEAVRSLPNWKPGRQRGKPVKQKMVMPITFKL